MVVGVNGVHGWCVWGVYGVVYVCSTYGGAGKQISKISNRSIKIILADLILVELSCS